MLFLSSANIRDLSPYIQLADLLNYLQDSDERIRNAGAFAMGGVTAGIVDKFFPTLLSGLGSSADARTRSLLLHAVKEVRLDIKWR